MTTFRLALAALLLSAGSAAAQMRVLCDGRLEVSGGIARSVDFTNWQQIEYAVGVRNISREALHFQIELVHPRNVSPRGTNLGYGNLGPGQTAWSRLGLTRAPERSIPSADVIEALVATCGPVRALPGRQ